MKRRWSILVVDDELGVRESLRFILNSSYDIHVAADGQEALQCLKKEKIDLVTLDLKMPGMSGNEVLKEIKKAKADIEVIIITAYGNVKNAEDAVRYGAGDFIVKPFDVAEITAKVSRSLERRSRTLRIRNLIHKIKAMVPRGESKAEELLQLTRSLCEILKEERTMHTFAEEEIENFISMTDKCSQWLGMNQSRKAGN